MTIVGMDMLISWIGNVCTNQTAILHILNNYNFLSVKYFVENNQNFFLGHNHVLKWQPNIGNNHIAHPKEKTSSTILIIPILWEAMEPLILMTECSICSNVNQLILK